MSEYLDRIEEHRDLTAGLEWEAHTERIRSWEDEPEFECNPCECGGHPACPDCADVEEAA